MYILTSMKALSQATVITIAAISLNLSTSLAKAEVSCLDVFSSKATTTSSSAQLFLAEPVGPEKEFRPTGVNDRVTVPFNDFLKKQQSPSSESGIPKTGDPHVDFLTQPLPVARALSETSKVTKEDVKLFNSNASSFKALSVFEKTMLTFHQKLYMYLIVKTFRTHDPLNSDNIQLSAQRLAEYETLNSGLQEIKYLLHVGRSKKRAFSAKVEIIKVLKVYSVFLTDLLGRDINLLRQEDFLEVFELSNRSELGPFSKELEKLFKEVADRQAKKFNAEPIEIKDLFDRLIEHFFGEGNLQVLDSNLFGAVSRIADQAEAIRLVKALRLSEKDEAQHLSEIQEIAAMIPPTSTASYLANMANALIVIRASEAVFGKSDGVYRPFKKYRRFEPKSYLHIRSMIEHSEHVRVITEAKLANYLDHSETHNARVAEMDASLTRISERSTSDIEKRVTALRTELRELEIKDFERNLDRRSQALLLLEIKLDQLREEVAKRTRRESITDFFELNNRWQRLIPEKAYLLDGTDYKAVTFSDDVIAFFDNNPLLGARYLATLGKNRYVAVHKQSGLRRLPGIHPDFRDIKVIRSHGKIRIIGRLVDDTIHFFHVYNSDKPYDNKSIERIVEQFSPATTQ